MLVGTVEALFFPDDVRWAEAQATLLDAGLGDGLPLVAPTHDRLAQMLRHIPDPTISLGQMPPLLGELTIEALAYCCVLAGCRPSELAVVATAASAVLAPEFNLLGVLTTTGTPAVCVVAHGAIVAELGMNSGANCLGPGNRSNACVGRAVNLVLACIGGAKPGVTDMATMGHPGKYAFCFAERQHELVPSLRVRRGLVADASAVTVIAVSGTLEVLPRHAGATSEDVFGPVGEAMHGARLACCAGYVRPYEEQFILVPPEVADLVQRRGWDLPAIQRYVFELPHATQAGAAPPLTRTVDGITCLVTGGDGVKMTCLAPWGGGSVSVTRGLLKLQA